MMGALHSVRLGWAKRVATVAAVSPGAVPRRLGHTVHGADAVEFTRFAQNKFDAASKAAKSAQHRAIRHKSATPFKPTCDMSVACFQARRPPAVN